MSDTSHDTVRLVLWEGGPSSRLYGPSASHGDARYAIIALWAPAEKIWVGFRSRTQLFGSIAAVLRYNCLSRIIASLICRILLIPTLGYFDDFGFFVHTPDEAEAMRDLTEFLAIIGMELKTDKSVIGSSDIFLGLAAYFPRPANGMSLAISLPREKARRWAKLIHEIITSMNMSHSTLESLIGRLSFAQTAVFGRFARAMTKPLYAKLFSPRYHPPTIATSYSQPTAVGHHFSILNT